MSARRCVVVFDIDNALCKSFELDLEYAKLFPTDEDVKCARDHHPECPIIVCKNNTVNYEFTHIFLPYLQVLFGYLLEQGTRIAFFSRALKDRNEEVIPALLISFWGQEKFEALRAKGQFNIHSSDDMRKGKVHEEGNYVKDFKTIIRDGELLSNVILVDDDYTYAARDQQPFVCVLDLSDWRACDRGYDCYKNSVFYILGLFKTYFEHEKYNKLPLREAFAKILPENYQWYSEIRKNESFKLNTMYLGLSEVQKQIPEARFYNPPNDSVRLRFRGW